MAHEERDENVNAWQPGTTRSRGERERARGRGFRGHTRQMDRPSGVYIVLLKYYPDCTIHLSQYNYCISLINIGSVSNKYGARWDRRSVYERSVVHTCEIAPKGPKSARLPSLGVNMSICQFSSWHWHYLVGPKVGATAATTEWDASPGTLSMKHPRYREPYMGWRLPLTIVIVLRGVTRLLIERNADRNTQGSRAWLASHRCIVHWKGGGSRWCTY